MIRIKEIPIDKELQDNLIKEVEHIKKYSHERRAKVIINEVSKINKADRLKFFLTSILLLDKAVAECDETLLVHGLMSLGAHFLDKLSRAEKLFEHKITYCSSRL